MIIYFAVSPELAKDFDHPVFNWTLKYGNKDEESTFWYFGKTAGSVLDIVRENKDLFRPPYAICRASLDDKEMVNALENALFGQRVTIDVAVLEVMWIKDD